MTIDRERSPEQITELIDNSSEKDYHIFVRTIASRLELEKDAYISFSLKKIERAVELLYEAAQLIQNIY